MQMYITLWGASYGGRATYLFTARLNAITGLVLYFFCEQSPKYNKSLCELQLSVS